MDREDLVICFDYVGYYILLGLWGNNYFRWNKKIFKDLIYAENSLRF